MKRLSMTAALAVWRAAVRDLGPELGGFPLWALLADNFPEESLAVCKVVAEQLKHDVRAPLSAEELRRQREADDAAAALVDTDEQF